MFCGPVRENCLGLTTLVGISAQQRHSVVSSNRKLGVHWISGRTMGIFLYFLKKYLKAVQRHKQWGHAYVLQRSTAFF